MKQGKTVVASLLIVFVTLGLDQWTKWAIVKSIKLNETVEMINHFFYLTYVQNTGAGFSMFAQAGMGFFSFYIFGYPFPVFNVADICITVGIALILISMFIDDKKEQAKWKQES